MMTESWKIEIGAVPPSWFLDAMLDDAIEPMPGEPGGTNGWATQGVRIVATGKIIPLGGTITKGDLA